jgi:hypothetical protein
LGKFGPEGVFQWHVLQVFVEQVLQELEELARRFDPPPMPKEDRSFWMSEL